MKLTGQRSLCRACGEYFNSVRAFDKHRYGDYRDRACLTRAEMLNSGMLVSSSGYWITKKFKNPNIRKA